MSSTNSNPLLTIIMPTYNSAATLDVALESITHQTFRNIEVLIIDGLSSDDTIEIANKHQLKFPQIKIISEADKGIYDAMNKGIAIAKGEWVYFMGSDDSLYETTTLEQFSNLKEIKYNDVIYGNVRIVGDTGWANDGDIYDGKFQTEKLLNKNISHQAIFYNTIFVKSKIGYFNLKYKKCSDWDFNLRCWSISKFKYVDLNFAYFVAGGLSTNTYDEVFADDIVNNITKYFKINLFNSLINTPNFNSYNKVNLLQKKMYPYRFKWEYFMKRIIKKIERTLSTIK